MSNFTVISYYTINTGYEKEVENLTQSLDYFDITYDIEGIDNLGDWMKNTQYKAEFIMKKLFEYENTPLVFIDADAVVKQYPVLFDNLDVDIAMHFRNGKELLSGTLYIQKSLYSLELLDAWILDNNKIGCIEQMNLQRLIKGNKIAGLKWLDLPASYCQIFDSMAGNGEPIIEHMQASRRLRKEVCLSDG